MPPLDIPGIIFDVNRTSFCTVFKSNIDRQSSAYSALFIFGAVGYTLFVVQTLLYAVVSYLQFSLEAKRRSGELSSLPSASNEPNSNIAANEVANEVRSESDQQRYVVNYKLSDDIRIVRTAETVSAFSTSTVRGNQALVATTITTSLVLSGLSAVNLLIEDLQFNSSNSSLNGLHWGTFFTYLSFLLTGIFPSKEVRRRQTSNDPARKYNIILFCSLLHDHPLNHLHGVGVFVYLIAGIPLHLVMTMIHSRLDGVCEDHCIWSLTMLSLSGVCVLGLVIVGIVNECSNDKGKFPNALFFVECSAVFFTTSTYFMIEMHTLASCFSLASSTELAYMNFWILGGVVLVIGTVGYFFLRYQCKRCSVPPAKPSPPP